MSSDGRILPEDIESAIKPNTCLVTVMLANNETGVIMPVAEISKLEEQYVLLGFKKYLSKIEL